MSGENRLRKSRDLSVVYEGRKLVALFIGRAVTRCTSFNCTVLVGVRVGKQGFSIQCLSIGQRGLGLFDAEGWRAGIQYTMSFHWSEGTGSFGCTKILGRVW